MQYVSHGVGQGIFDRITTQIQMEEYKQNISTNLQQRFLDYKIETVEIN